MNKRIKYSKLSDVPKKWRSLFVGAKRVGIATVRMIKDKSGIIELWLYA